MIPQVSDSELELMQIVWDCGGRALYAQIMEALTAAGRSWQKNTVITLLSRLVDKGFLSCQKRGKSNWYHPLVSEKDYKAAEGRGLIDRLYGSSFTGMVASLCDGRAIDEDDLAQLRQYLDTLEGK